MGRRVVVRAGRPSGAAVALAGLGVLAALVAGMVVSFRAAGLVLAAVLLLCGAARAVLPVAALGRMAVRSRAVDVITCTVLALALAALAVTAPAGS